jgi:hypothetical protein
VLAVLFCAAAPALPFVAAGDEPTQPGPPAQVPAADPQGPPAEAPAADPQGPPAEAPAADPQGPPAEAPAADPQGPPAAEQPVVEQPPAEEPPAPEPPAEEPPAPEPPVEEPPAAEAPDPAAADVPPAPPVPSRTHRGLQVFSGGELGVPDPPTPRIGPAAAQVPSSAPATQVAEASPPPPDVVSPQQQEAAPAIAGPAEPAAGQLEVVRTPRERARARAAAQRRLRLRRLAAEVATANETGRAVPAPAAPRLATPQAAGRSEAARSPAAKPAPAQRPRIDKDPRVSVPIVPVVFNALSESVAFVPVEVWAAFGGMAALALAMFAFALVRDRHARRLVRERRALIADLRALEGAVVPELPEHLGGLALSVVTQPSEGVASGGDFHDAFALSRDRVAVIVGDVAGQGRQALADAQLVRHAVRAYLEAGLDPRSALAMTGAVVEEREDRLFASVVVAVHDRREGTLTFASAGHEPPILVSAHGASLPPVPGWSPPLGTGLETGRRQTQIPFAEGTAVCLLTDGVTEARSEGERMGSSRILRWLSALGPGAMAGDVVARLREEADAADEDVTVCMLRALTPPAPDVPRIEEAVVEGGDPTYLVRFLRDCGLPLADAEEAGEALAAAPDGTRMIASVEIRGGRAIVELAPLRGGTSAELVF